MSSEKMRSETFKSPDRYKRLGSILDSQISGIRGDETPGLLRRSQPIEIESTPAVSKHNMNDRFNTFTHDS